MNFRFNIGKAADDIAWLTREARELNRLNEIFAGG